MWAKHANVSTNWRMQKNTCIKKRVKTSCKAKGETRRTHSHTHTGGDWQVALMWGQVWAWQEEGWQEAIRDTSLDDNCCVQAKHSIKIFKERRKMSVAVKMAALRLRGHRRVELRRAGKERKSAYSDTKGCHSISSRSRPRGRRCSTMAERRHQGSCRHTRAKVSLREKRWERLLASFVPFFFTWEENQLNLFRCLTAGRKKRKKYLRHRFDFLTFKSYEHFSPLNIL